MFAPLSLHVLYTGATLFLSLIESDISMGLNYIVSLLTKDSGGAQNFPLLLVVS